LQWLGDAVKF